MAIKMVRTINDPTERARRWAQLYAIFSREEKAVTGVEVSEATNPVTASDQQRKPPVSEIVS